MTQEALVSKLSCWLQDAGTKLQRGIARSPRIRLALLGGLALCGHLLMLSPFITLLGTVSAIAYLGDNIRGPLDWFLIEICAALGLVATLACYQLARMRPASAKGIALTEDQAPLLFSMLGRRTTHFGVHRRLDVKLAGDAKLHVVTRPRWIVPFSHSCTLSIGAPLLYFLSDAQFRLALAGAIAASTRSRRNPVDWIRQIAQDWPVIIGVMREHTCMTSRLLLPTMQLIAAGSVQLSKSSNTEALQEQTRWVRDQTDDATARELLTSQVMASAFLSSHYWPMILKAAEHCPEPVVRPFSHFALLLRKSFTKEAASRWLLRAQSGGDSTHTGLPDLLAELQLDCLCGSTLPERHAFGCILNDRKMLQALDKYWQQDINADWQRRHSEFQLEKKRFEQLKKLASQNGLRGNSAINFIRLASRFLEPGKTIEAYRNVYRSNTDDPTVCFASGQAMLEAGHTLEGCDAIQRASELDGRLTNRAHALVSQHQQFNPGRRSHKPRLARIA